MAGGDPKLDLKLERVVDVPRELVWTAWTVPEHLPTSPGGATAKVLAHTWQHKEYLH